MGQEHMTIYALAISGKILLRYPGEMPFSHSLHPSPPFHSQAG
ncbi:hypothetical protein Mnod_2266 [Methylobacterium nodulans ORS 2060]|uniref:Uncharacterized protein n=1 Tax=Methylobacterium nodulans (strain LMG 21967 / CNCM I-2342 / ORS 2060) TaxID=460265 RepID=B8IA18_METNO|nr:hypothetical protein Mnod_2266 [Methylobacterium nodulans ORS 2060]